MGMGVGQATGAGRGRRPRRAPVAEINVTPLVDVMLVLLIIFMITAPMMNAGVPVDLPESRANALDEKPDQITISIDTAGVIYIDDGAVADGQLATALESLAANAGGTVPLVTLRADKTLDYGRVMAVMGELNRAGFNSISLVTQGSAGAP